MTKHKPIHKKNLESEKSSGKGKSGPKPDPRAKKNRSGNYTRDEVCFVRGEKLVVNLHSGNSVSCNTLDDMMIIPSSWSAKKSKEAVDEWDREISAQERHLHPVMEIWDEAKGLSGAKTPEEFKILLDHLLAMTFHKNLHRNRYDKSRGRLGELCVALWRKGCLLWPKSPWVFNLIHIPVESWMWGECQPIVSDCHAAFKGSEAHGDRARFRLFVDFLLSRTPPSSVLDITPDGERFVRSRASAAPYSRVVSGILFLQKEAKPEGNHYTLGDFGYGYEKPRERSDKTFSWVLSRDKDMDHWRSLCESFLEGKEKAFLDTITALNMWLDYLIENPSLPRNPVEFFDRDKQNGRREFDPKDGKKGKRLAIIHDFLEFCLIELCSEEDDYGNPKILPRFKNPMVRPLRIGENRIETHREPMPTRFISLCLDILTERDFAWPKSFGAGPKSSDWFKRRDPDTGLVVDEWSPVRTFFLILKLMLPARTYQLRMVDSGEGDSLVYRTDGTGWEKNSGPHAPAKGSGDIQKGIFRKYRRKDGSEGSLMFFNTNKTADTDLPVHKRGFVMPWEHKKALNVFAKLRDWQMEKNPVKAPQKWADLTELKARKHEAELDRMGESYFLFRDPAGGNPSQPLTDSRVRSMWVALIVELERRLALSGERLPNGEPISLVTSKRRDGKSPVGVLFDLHTLRVTMITALYEEGVPAEMIMKIVGHASVLMTLYYTKISAQSISDSLDEATMRRQQDEQGNWIGFLRAKSREQIRSLAAHAHPSALDAFHASSGAGMVVMDHGFCPMGARRCSDGLISMTQNGVESFSAVPGGASNCERCRFFITGPAFLVGLEARLNDLSYRLKCQSKTYQDAQGEFDKLDALRSEALESGEPFGKLRELQASEAAFENATATVDETALSLQACWRLIEQSLEIAEKSDGDGSCSLIVRGDGDGLKALLEEAHEVEQLQRVCVSAKIFKSLKIDRERANLERMRLFDRMLAKNGISPFF